MFNSITKRIIAGFSIILIIITTSTIYNILGFMDNKDHIIHIKEVAAQSLKLTNNMKKHIIETRLYFEEASASKDVSRISKAQEHADFFRMDSNELVKLDDSYKKGVDELTISFLSFFDYGTIVVQASARI